MKLSTRIKKTCGGWFQCRNGLEFIPDTPIVFMVDCKRWSSAIFFEDADSKHRELLSRGCKLLPEECPVYNENEVIIHYTTTTYRDWCNLLL